MSVAKGVTPRCTSLTSWPRARCPGHAAAAGGCGPVIKRHDAIVTKDDVDTIEKELWKTPIDTVAMMGRGKRRAVMNKQARHNNCMIETRRPPSRPRTMPKAGVRRGPADDP